MEEALEYCFGFIRNTEKIWLNLEKEPEKRLRFQKLIFEENVEFSGEKFGTTKLTQIYSVYQEYLRDPSTLVSHSGLHFRHPQNAKNTVLRDSKTIAKLIEVQPELTKLSDILHSKKEAA